MLRNLVLCLMLLSLTCASLIPAYAEEVIQTEPIEAAAETVEVEAEPIQTEAELLIEINELSELSELNIPVAASSLLIPPSEDSVTVYINGAALQISASLVDGVTYVSLADFCCAVNANTEIIWDKTAQSVSVSAPSAAFTLNLSDPYIVVNERYLYMPGGVIVSGDVILAPIRILAKALGAEIIWDSSINAVHIIPGAAPLVSGNKYYDEESVYWLSRIISAESRGEPLEGQIAVGNVVMNRVAYKSYPSSIYGVIFDKVGGVQFTPVSNGSIYNEPTKSAVTAAKLVLDGADTAGDSLFFMNAAIATSKWIKNNRTFVSTIGNHDFYA